MYCTPIERQYWEAEAGRVLLAPTQKVDALTAHHRHPRRQLLIEVRIDEVGDAQADRHIGVRSDAVLRRGHEVAGEQRSAFSGEADHPFRTGKYGNPTLLRVLHFEPSRVGDEKRQEMPIFVGVLNELPSRGCWTRKIELQPRLVHRPNGRPIPHTDASRQRLKRVGGYEIEADLSFPGPFEKGMFEEAAVVVVTSVAERFVEIGSVRRLAVLDTGFAPARHCGARGCGISRCGVTGEEPMGRLDQRFYSISRLRVVRDPARTLFGERRSRSGHGGKHGQVSHCSVRFISIRRWDYYTAPQICWCSIAFRR